MMRRKTGSLLWILLLVICVLGLFFFYIERLKDGNASNPQSIMKSPKHIALRINVQQKSGMRWNVLHELRVTCEELARRIGHVRSPRNAIFNHNGDNKMLSSEHYAMESFENHIHKKQVNMWSTDFHISPIADIKAILKNEIVSKKREELKNFNDDPYNVYNERNFSLDVRIHDNSLSGHCHLTQTCASKTSLQYLNKLNGLGLGKCPSKLRSDFYLYYSQSTIETTFRSVDAFLCQHAASLCELYMPFNRTMIIIVSTRYELGRGEDENMYGHLDLQSDTLFKERYETAGFDEDLHVQQINEHYRKRWSDWNTNLQRINGGLVGNYLDCPDDDDRSLITKIKMSSFPRCMRGSHVRHNVIAANNLYDKFYMEYFTGIRDVALLPSTAQHIEGIRWNYTKLHNTLSSDSSTLQLPFLLGPARRVHSSVEGLLQAAVLQIVNNTPHHERSPILVQISDIYPDRFEYIDLAQHPGVVLVPYQVSIMSFYEYYRMGLPIFAPTARLLTQWHMKYRLLSERSWAMTRLRPQHRSMLPPFTRTYKCGARCNEKAERERHAALKAIFQHDPNNEFSEQAVHAWVQLADFYTWPHVVLFDSPEELAELLSPRASLATELQDISDSMLTFMRQVDASTKRAWSYIIEGVLLDRRHRRYSEVDPETYPTNVNEALQEQYGYQLDTTDCYSEKKN